jgi:hypothetical protein
VKDTLQNLWDTVQTVAHVLTYVFGGAVVVLLVLVGCLVVAIWKDRGADAASAAKARRIARDYPAREMPRQAAP